MADKQFTEDQQQLYAGILGAAVAETCTAPPPASRQHQSIYRQVAQYVEEHPGQQDPTWNAAQREFYQYLPDPRTLELRRAAARRETSQLKVLQFIEDHQAHERDPAWTDEERDFYVQFVVGLCVGGDVRIDQLDGHWSADELSLCREAVACRDRTVGPPQ